MINNNVKETYAAPAMELIIISTNDKVLTGSDAPDINWNWFED